MIIVQVHIHVKDEEIQAFKTASIENAKKSILEPGIIRFDVIQQLDDPARFVLLEAYRDETAITAHKQTDHYSRWRSEAEEMMEEPRYSIKYSEIYPDDTAKWQYP